MTFTYVFKLSSEVTCGRDLTADGCRGEPASKVGLNKCRVTERFAKIHQTILGPIIALQHAKKYGPPNRVLAANPQASVIISSLKLLFLSRLLRTVQALVGGMTATIIVCEGITV